MKELIIPTKQENKIDISEITLNFKGLVIAYKDEKPVGYFQTTDSGYWIFLTKSYYDSMHPMTEESELITIIKDAMAKDIFNKCKVIEFED